MKKYNWHGIMQVLEIQHIRNNNVIWQANNIKNLLHNDGEEFLLNIAFAGLAVPTQYYLGLDNRDELSPADTMFDIQNENLEPNFGGYVRQAVSNFTINFDSGHFRAISPIVAFQADIAGLGWGPVRNIFLTDQDDFSGFLISSVSLGTILTTTPGDTVTMRMQLQAKDCPPV